MTTPPSHQIDRRTLISRAAALAALAGAMHANMPALSAQASPEAQEGGIPALVAGNTTFALDLYHQLRQDVTDNLLVSPYSISLALAMTLAGARGDTAGQIAATMSYPTPGPELHEALGALTDDLLERGNVDRDDEGGGEGGLRIANALWGEESISFDPAFVDQLAEQYGAGLQETDFINAPDTARQEINDWVAEETENRIQNIVPPGVIDAATRLVLANAIYFYGAWREPFKPENTDDDTFHLPDGTTIDVPFMSQREQIPYARANGMQLVELPYNAGGFAMTILLPDEGQFDTVEDALDPDTLTTAIAALERTDVRLWFPKFEFEYAASLASTLHTLGITDAFEPARADFTGMVAGAGTPQDLRDNLVIGNVLHRAFISVDEDGTEAAAATVVTIGVTSAAPGDETEPIEVRVDRPFLFAIRDTETGTILFLGRVTDPAS